jgi:hypothetical protein
VWTANKKNYRKKMLRSSLLLRTVTVGARTAAQQPRFIHTSFISRFADNSAAAGADAGDQKVILTFAAVRFI